MPWLRVVKDTDVCQDVIDADAEALGYCGTDKWEETDPALAIRLQATDRGELDGLRFALAATPQKTADIRAKLRLGEPLWLGTSYPTIMRRVMGYAVLQPLVRAGAIEGLPARFPQLDGIFELVKSGDSLRANGLVTVVDELEKVRLVEIRQKEVSV